jgi:hypothetical protein
METVRPRTVLHVSRNVAGDIEIALIAEPGSLESLAGLSLGGEKRSLVVRERDIPVLIEMLEHILDDDDPEDRSTVRNLRPVARALLP